MSSEYGLSVLDPSSSSSSLSSSLPHSYSSSTLLAHSIPTRRILSRLDKTSIINLCLIWLNSKSISILPPILTHNPSSTDAPHQDLSQQDLEAAKRLINSKPSSSLKDLIHLWDVSMRSTKVPKVRAVERVLEVDWPRGFTYEMLAMIDSCYVVGSSLREDHVPKGEVRVGTRTWVAGKLIYPVGHKASSPSPPQLHSLFSQELRHYFSHYLHLYPTTSTSSFIHFRLTPAPSTLDLCCSTPLHILLIPGSPFLLFSGTLGSNVNGGGASEMKEMSFAALAQSLGGLGIRVPESGIGGRGKKKIGEDESLDTDGDESRDENGRERESLKRTRILEPLPELKGKDPLALKAILLGSLGDSNGNSISDDLFEGHCNLGGGKSRGLKRGDLEDNPLIRDEKRRRKEDESFVEESEELEGNENQNGEVDIERILRNFEENGKGKEKERIGLGLNHPAQRELKKKFKNREIQDRKREAEEIFGEDEDEMDRDLPKVERIDYELHLPFPTYPPYHQPSSLSTHLPNNSSSSSTAEPIRLRLEGTHVLAGLRQLVSQGLDKKTPTGEPSNETNLNSRNKNKRIEDEGKGLPDWLTNVKGTKVVAGKKENKKRK